MTLPETTIHAFRAGEADAFESVVRALAPKVAAVAGHFFRSEFEREEALQEIWLHAYRQRETLDPGRLDSFEGWLATLARRRCLDLLRRAPGAGEEPAGAEELAGHGPDPQRQAELAQVRQAVDQFAGKLKPGWRSFFQLHFVEGLGYEEVAARLNISRLRCKYMKKVLAARARRNPGLAEALGRRRERGGHA